MGRAGRPLAAAVGILAALATEGAHRHAHGQSQTLPPIVVTAPSPLMTAATAIPPGGLIVVEDAFAPVTVLPEDEIQRLSAGTIGGLLAEKPGLSASSFAPGASRPVIRGLDNFRVRIQENGVGVHDLSDFGEDHAVAIDPLAAQKVEIVRGPATLRYGSQAIGGVVDVGNNRIPAMLPQRGIAFVGKSALTSVDRGHESAALLDAGGRNVALHVDAFERRAGDYAIPPGGRQANSGVNSRGHSVGASLVFDQGFVGASVTRLLSRYGIPGEEAAASGNNIDLDQTRLQAKGEYRPDAQAITAVRFWFGATQYQHDERGTEDGVTGILSTFRNRQQEGRVEIGHAPLASPLGMWSGALGVQAGRQRIATQGEAEEFLLPAHSNSVAAYLFEELRLSETLKFQAAGRIESAKRGGTAGIFPGDYVYAGADPGLEARSRAFKPMSVSAGFLQRLPQGVVASLTGQYVERAPTAPELFSKGAHHASETFEIGNPDLGKEKARTVEFGLRRGSGDWRFDASAYYTKYSGFIYKALTGNTCGHEFAACVAGAGEELTQVVHAQRDATFRGIEIATQLDLFALGNGAFGVEGQYDIVRATFADGSNVPRITPQRLGGGLFWRNENWLAKVGLLHAFAQNRVGDNETPTAGYDNLKAELSYTRRYRPVGFGPQELVLGISANNLLDDDMRNHVSFNKNEVLLPGRSIKGFATLRF